VKYTAWIVLQSNVSSSIFTFVSFANKGKTISNDLSSFISGWKSKRLKVNGQRKRLKMPTNYKQQKYSSIKSACLKKGELFEDPEFPANSKSLFFSKIDQDVVWKRPSVSRQLIKTKYIIFSMLTAIWNWSEKKRTFPRKHIACMVVENRSLFEAGRQWW